MRNMFSNETCRVDATSRERLTTYLLAGLLTLCGVRGSEAATYYVSPLGNDANSCASAQNSAQTNQKRTIAGGVACAFPGDTVQIHGGTYTGANNTIDSQRFTVRSGTPSSRITIEGYPGERVTISPSNGQSGISLQNGSPAYLTFKNFTIDMVNNVGAGAANGIYASGARSIWCDGIEVKNGDAFGVHHGTTPDFRFINGSVHDVGAAGSASTEGHGLYVKSSDGLYENNEVYNNQGYGFHVYNNAGTHADPSRNILRNNRIYGNGVHGSPAYAIVITWGDGNLVINNLIYRNRGGIVVYTGASNTGIYNNTIYGNNDEGVVLQYYSAGTTVRNNIIHANGAGIVDHGGTAAPLSDHNLMTNPSFVNASTGDFRLQAGSAALNAGVAIASVTDDFARTPRPQQGAYDIGAFEFVGSSTGPAAPGAAMAIRVH